MGLMNWIRQKLGTVAPQSTSAGALVATPLTQLAEAPMPARPGDWKALSDALAQILMPEQMDRLGAEVQLALIQSDQYFSRFANDLTQRGIDSPQEVSAWLALVDGLQRREQNVELDWRLDLDELISSLSQLRTVKELGLVFDDLMADDAASEMAGEDALGKAAIWLRSKGLALVCMDIDSDSYPLMLLPLERVDAIKVLAERVGQKLMQFDVA
ncbi:DUF6630 family protein [Comamonas sp.]|uniref:DUF6630 family protein n=1 Tax=Comamonas sp. TaxID=34028 RepID=UPI002FC8D0C8